MRYQIHCSDGKFMFSTNTPEKAIAWLEMGFVVFDSHKGVVCHTDIDIALGAYI